MTQLFAQAIYVNASDKHLLDAARPDGPSRKIPEGKRWTTGAKLLTHAKEHGCALPLIFAQYSTLSFWAKAAAIQLSANGSTYTFTDLQPLVGKRRSDLIVDSSGGPLPDTFIRSYAIVRTPDFLLKSQLPPPASQKIERYVWGQLNRQQVGAYAEYFVKMELTMFGFQVYSTEVDDRGIDFVARYGNGRFIEVQVKSLRSTGYVFMHKSKFALSEELYLALAIFREREPPDLYLIPSFVWDGSGTVFVGRDYEGLKSKPEWGVNVCKKNMAALEPYRFEKTMSVLVRPDA